MPLSQHWRGGEARRRVAVLCVSWLLSIAVFAAVGVSQQTGSRRAASGVHRQASKLADQRLGITLEDGRLSVNVQDRSLERLAEEISGKAGIPIVLSDDIGSQPVSVNFQNLPVDEGLRQILKKYDAFFFYGVDEQESSSLKVVWAYAKGKGRGVAPVPAEKWASTKELDGMLANKDPQIRARVIEALAERKGQGAQEAVLRSLEDVDDQVRARALYAGIKAGVEVPEQTLSNLARNDESQDVRLLALKSLSNSPDARGIAESALNDASEPVRVLAHEILARLDEQANATEPPADQQEENQAPENR